MMHWHTQWRTTQNCSRVEPIWIDSENKFTPLFTRHIQLCNSKIKVLSKRWCNLKEAKPQMPATACSYCCYTACIRFLVCHPIKYSILNTISPLSSKGFHCRCYVIYMRFLFKRTIKTSFKSVLYRWISSNQLTHHS